MTTAATARRGTETITADTTARDAALVWLRLTTYWTKCQDADQGLRLEVVRPLFPTLSRERLDRALIAL